MPEADQILDGLGRIANEGFAAAVLWHIAIAGAAILLVLGWRPAHRTAAALLAVPILSVSAFAFSFENPFNGIAFALLGGILLAIGLRLGGEPVARAPGWAALTGIALVGFGLVYPHFLAGRWPLAYLYGAPTGLVPCPTLSVVIGFALLGDGLRSRSWSVVVGAAGLAYALFGGLRLGVHIDLVLLAGAAALLVRAALSDRVLIARGAHPPG